MITKKGLLTVIGIKLPDPQFEGQKQQLGNREVQGLVEAVINEQLGIYCEETPSTAKAIINKGIDAARAREAARKVIGDPDAKKGALEQRKPALKAGRLFQPGRRDIWRYSSLRVFLQGHSEAGKGSYVSSHSTAKRGYPECREGAHWIRCWAMRKSGL